MVMSPAAFKPTVPPALMSLPRTFKFPPACAITEPPAETSDPRLVVLTTVVLLRLPPNTVVVVRSAAEMLMSSYDVVLTGC